jgi:hypothetical protein
MSAKRAEDGHYEECLDSGYEWCICRGITARDDDYYAEPSNMFEMENGNYDNC